MDGQTDRITIASRRLALHAIPRKNGGRLMPILFLTCHENW